jgi:glycosyltransferase involved in cell wall biosynthesis
MPDVYAALDVFVLPSWREGFSRSGMEAAASGLPMVLTDIRGCREIGTDGEHVLLVPPRRPDRLAAAIEQLLDDADLRKSLGSAARSRAQAEFDQRRVARRSLETYVRVAGRRGLSWRLEEPP